MRQPRSGGVGAKDEEDAGEKIGNGCTLAPVSVRRHRIRRMQVLTPALLLPTQVAAARPSPCGARSS